MILNTNNNENHSVILLPQSSRPSAAGSIVVVPAGQVVQFVFMKPEAYVPLEQAKHLASPVGEKYPGLHFSVKETVSKRGELESSTCLRAVSYQ